MGNIKIKRGVFDSKLELLHAGVRAGFPSPAEDYMHETLDFNRDYIRHPEASFYGDVEGDSMKDAGIFDGDRVIIDKAVEAHNGSIVVAFWNGEFTMKYLDLTHKKDVILNCDQPTLITPSSRWKQETTSRSGASLSTSSEPSRNSNFLLLTSHLYICTELPTLIIATFHASASSDLT